MMRIVAATSIFLMYLTQADIVGAEWRCDCTTILDSCTASVDVRPEWIEVTSDSSQCSRVDYFVDGLPFVSVVVNGVSRENWLSRADTGRVMVQSCQVCRDNGQESSVPDAAPAQIAADAALTAIVETRPEYPPAAQARGIEGEVTVNFTVTPFGSVESPRITNAEPAGVFDMAALSAIGRWRYPADPQREPVNVTETIEFRLSDFIFELGDATGDPTSSVSARAVNQCLRQNASYDFGEMIDVELINACAEPLAVFACAIGSGPLTGRWACVDTESRNELLAAADGTVRGSIARQGTAIFRLAEEFSITRAPNTAYWWLACRAENRQCRGQGRQWLRSIDGQTSALDPSKWTTLAVNQAY